MAANQDFRDIIGRRAQPLLRMAGYLVQQASACDAMTRPLLADLLSEATQLEELLDACGARNNRQWHLFRLLVATIKRFADATYEILHIRYATPSYRLLPISRDFQQATRDALSYTADVLLQAATRLLARARRLGMPIPDHLPNQARYAEQLPPGQLPQDCASRKLKTVAETVTHLATAFLNLAAESQPVHAAGRAKPEQYTSCIPHLISEENLRDLQHRFHNLQSLYDTYVSQTESEGLDPGLPVLRGHISVVFHLLKTGTEFAHYYERHATTRRKPLVEPQPLAATLLEYSISYASQYIFCARQLCQAMLQRYAEVTEIEVPVPRYRGFHVRPSTLVAKIVLHYGSQVHMEMDGEVYDASTPLEIFRANERINARKRQWLAQEIARLPEVRNHSGAGDVQGLARAIVMTLAEQGKLVLYEQPLRMPQEPVPTTGTVLQQVIDEIARLQAIAKIDINADLSIRIHGDKRVLADVALLADSGYGEDNSGNNIPLPEELGYLRR